MTETREPDETPDRSLAEQDMLPNDFQDRESRQIDLRRHKASVTGAKNDFYIGMSISGGGIRSATFGLGFLQELSRLGKLKHIDYLSTVSGGSYIGSFLGSLFIPQNKRLEKTHCAAPSDVGKAVSGALLSESPEIRSLRNNGRYIAPNGAGDLLVALATAIRNWVSVLMVMLTLILMYMLSFDLLYLLALKAPLQDFKIYCSHHSIHLNLHLIVPMATCLVCAVPPSIAYWVVPMYNQRTSKRLPAVGGLLTCVVIGSLLFALRRFLPTSTIAIGSTIGLIIFISVVLAEITIFMNCGADEEERNDTARNLLSLILKAAILLCALVTYGVLIDVLAQHLFLHGNFENLPIISVILIPARPLFVFLLTYLPKSISSKGVSRIMINSACVLLSFVLVSCILVILAYLSKAITYETMTFNPSEHVPSLVMLSLVWTLALVLSIIFGWTYQFINLSSYAQFYYARLTRAYLGSSNKDRLQGNSSLSKLVPGDDISMSDYAPHLEGGPLHIINVTINETLDGRSQQVQQDRKGLNMAIGPAGLSVGVKHHGTWDTETVINKKIRILHPIRTNVSHAVFPHGTPLSTEPLSLGRWVAISGAAISTGMGQQTSVGMSLLCGIFNIRLGYWWDSGLSSRWTTSNPVSGADKLFFVPPTQRRFLSEFFALFTGPTYRDWYLTDGGHFENTGCYELIRRRLPYIIVLDSGVDSDYLFVDLGNLVHKARVDLGAHISFLQEEELTALLPDDLRPIFGTLAQLRRGQGSSQSSDIIELNRQKMSKSYATIAKITYDNDDRKSIVLIVKPTLIGSEPLDILAYHSEYTDFPQESTADQFFGEVQWECYRKLGEIIAQKMFDNSQRSLMSDRWTPCSMSLPNKW